MLPEIGRELAGTLYLLLPLAGGALAHAACMKWGWLAFLTRPIDGGRTLGGRPLFGRSKTWRGPITVAAGSAATYALQRHLLHGMPVVAELELVDYASLPGWWLGALLGAAAELTELPNSFTKRRLGIAPGGTDRGPRGALFFLWDQVDVLLGFWLVAATVVPPTPLRLAGSLILVAAFHPLLTVLGYVLGVRPTAR